jgi:gentisate 1,2-dioxygenase
MSALETPGQTIEVGYDELCGALAARDMKGLWSFQTRLMPEIPVPATQPWLWTWEVIHRLARQAGEVVTIERGGDRRVLALVNPGLRGLPFTSSTLWGAVQYLGPGESAPAHRHSPSAIRFVMKGAGGVYTTVDGDACDMEEGDLILTPNWMWHDHMNAGDEEMLWFDGLDLPIVSTLESIFFENHPQSTQPIDGRNRSEAAFAGVGLRRTGGPAGRDRLLRYPWTTMDRALATLEQATGEPLVVLEYTDPLSGRPAVPTFSCEMMRIRPGTRSPSVRKTGSSVFVVLHGRGRTIIAGQQFDWSPGDVFVAPSWAAVDHEALEPADVFILSDRPVIQLLQLYREEVLAAPQPIESTFQPVQ